MSKLDKLIGIALSGCGQISKEITAKNLKRLDTGELSHIGDALVEGKAILWSGCNGHTLSFCSAVSDYTVSKPKLKVAGKEVDATPLKYDDMEKELEYWCVDFSRKSNCTDYCFNEDDYDYQMFNSNLAFATKEEAERVAQALIDTMEVK